MRNKIIFIAVTHGDEAFFNSCFYPFMPQSEYPGVACYKMKKIIKENLFLN